MNEVRTIEYLERSLASVKWEKEKLHARCVKAEELFLEIQSRRPHEMYWVYRALAAERALQENRVTSPHQGSHAG